MKNRIAKKILKRPLDKNGLGKYTSSQISAALSNQTIVDVLFADVLLPSGWTLFNVFPKRPPRQMTAEMRKDLLMFIRTMNGANANPT